MTRLEGQARSVQVDLEFKLYQKSDCGQLNSGSVQQQSRYTVCSISICRSNRCSVKACREGAFIPQVGGLTVWWELNNIFLLPLDFTTFKKLKHSANIIHVLEIHKMWRGLAENAKLCVMVTIQSKASHALGTLGVCRDVLFAFTTKSIKEFENERKCKPVAKLNRTATSWPGPRTTRLRRPDFQIRVDASGLT